MKPSLQAVRMRNTNTTAMSADQLFDRAKQHMDVALSDSDDSESVIEAQTLAAECFLAAANQGHKPAQLQFGLMALNGFCTERNYILGMHWIEQSIVNHRDNALWLAAAYMTGDHGIQCSPHLAASIYKSLAISNDTYAIYSLACLHEAGLGAEQSYALARRLLERAAKDGHFDAQNKLSHYYSSGLGGEANSELAQYWSEKAANNSDQAYLASMGER